MPKLLDQHGTPIDTTKLRQEEAVPTLTGTRSILSDHPSRGLTPQRLAAILLEAEQSDPMRYLELAEDMEEKDLHYQAQLRTRKYAVSQLKLDVVAASDEAADVQNADLVRDMLTRDDVEEILVDVLDAIGKGFSVCEILWDLSERQWMPRDIIYRDPRWFTFDRTDGRTLLLRDGAECRPLTPFKYITHIHQAKSGLPVRGGLARLAGWAYLFKNYALKDWVQFAEIFGQPYRVGKYHPSASKEDKERLLRAVASIGTDAAAIIPEGMVIEFIEAARSGSIDLYEKLCTYIDAQVSKAVLGQTLTSDVSRDGGSRALGEVHDEVRGDIKRSDSRQLAATLNRCLVRPLVDLNVGVQKRYPKLRIGLPDELTTMQKIEALRTLVPYGLEVETSQVRDLIGFTEPAKEAAVLRRPTHAPAPTIPDIGPEGRRPSAAAQRAIQAEQPAGQADAVDELVAQALADEGWRPVMEPQLAAIQELLATVPSLEEFRARLPEVVPHMDEATLVELLSRLTFAARTAGELEIPLDRPPASPLFEQQANAFWAAVRKGRS